MTSRREDPPGPLRVMAMCTIVLVPALALVGVLALAAAQKRVPRVGVLAPATPTPHLLDALRQGLREHGWVEGRNVAVEYRSAEGQSDRLDGLAGEIVRADVDLIVALHAPAARAAARATRMIPIVMVSVSSSAESGLIASLARVGTSRAPRSRTRKSPENASRS